VRGTGELRRGHTIESTWRDRSQGLYCEWRWDGKRLQALTDPLGFFPLFYHVNGSSVMVSPSLETLLQNGAPAELDAVALGVFTAFGFFLGEDTPFAQIKVLPPGGRLVWDGELRLTGEPWCARAESLGQEAAVEGFVDLARQAVRRRLPSGRRCALPLSGGRDSRYLLFSLLEAGEKPDFCITGGRYPPFTDDDVEIAAMVARELSLRHVVVPPPLRRVVAETRRIRKTHFLTDEHAWLFSVVDALRQDGAETSYDGIGGDVLTGLFLKLKWRPSYEAGRLDEATEQILDRLPVLAPTIPLDGPVSFPRDDVAARIQKELRRHAHTPNPVTQFMFWNRTRREIALVPACMLAGITSYCPFLDTDFYTFLSALGPEVTGSHTIHDRAFHAAFPRYAHLPFAPRGRKRRAFGHYASFSLELAAYALSRGEFALTWRYPRRLLNGLARREKLGRLSPEMALYYLELNWLIRRVTREDVRAQRV
jgi:asparagine synthase (glutamine-hydrolysing)